MSDDDLIRRGDALAVVSRDRVPTNKSGTEFRVVSTQELWTAIARLPAVTAPVKEASAKGETPGEMLDRLGMDGVKWAAEFRTTALRLGYSDMDEGWLIGWFCNAIMAGYDHAPSPPSGRIKMNEKPFVVRVGDVVEHEDGGATYSFDLDDDSAEGLAKIGLEFVLYCAAYDLDLQYVLDNLKRLKDAT